MSLKPGAVVMSDKNRAELGQLIITILQHRVIGLQLHVTQNWSSGHVSKIESTGFVAPPLSLTSGAAQPRHGTVHAISA